MDAYPKNFFANSSFEQQSGKCFVIMPFAAEFNQIYDTIRETLVAPELNFICSRSDDRRGGGHILEDVFREIAQSELIIADLSGRNPNVYYELGIVQMVKDVKKVILLNQDRTPVFDVAAFRSIFYEPSTDGAPELRAALIAAVKEVADTAVRFELRGSPGTYKLPSKRMGPDHILYDFEIRNCVYAQDGVKVDVYITRHIINQPSEVLPHIEEGLNNGERIRLPGLEWDLVLEHGTCDVARFVAHKRV